MSPITFSDGAREQRVRLQDVTVTPTADGEGLETAIDLTPAVVHAAIVPAMSREFERTSPGSSLSTASHLITIDYHPGVSTRTQIQYDDPRAGTTRIFRVHGVQNPEEASAILILTAEEITTRGA